MWDSDGARVPPLHVPKIDISWFDEWPTSFQIVLDRVQARFDDAHNVSPAETAPPFHGSLKRGCARPCRKCGEESPEMPRDVFWGDVVSGEGRCDQVLAVATRDTLAFLPDVGVVRRNPLVRRRQLLGAEARQPGRVHSCPRMSWH